MHIPTNKSELRKILRDRRRAIPGTERSQASHSVANRLQVLAAWGRAKHVALYLPADGEIDTTDLAALARESGASLYLPVVKSDEVMHFALWEQDAILRKNTYGIPEPGPESGLLPADQLDLVVMPLVGWDKRGTRLGMGGGFYDRALAGAPHPVRVGLAFECQHVEELPAESWDIPMNFVVTEAALHTCGGKN